MTNPPTSFRSFRALPRLARFDILLLAAMAAAFSLRLWPDWRHNPDLSHGLFMPVIFLALVFESRHQSPRFLRDNIALRLVLTGLLVGAVAAMIAAGLYAAAVDWSHPLVNSALAAALVLFLGAGWIVLATDSLRFIGWNWTAFVAISLWLLCTPIPPGTYSRLTLSLQLWISESVLRALHLLGIAAVRHGNIIELARATVGVEEACSGVRSLVSCIFAGLFFSATLVRRPWARAFIVVAAGPLALGMNFLRSLTLTLLANAGVDISGLWHDLTGFAVLGLTAAILALLAIGLERIARPSPVAPSTGTASAKVPRGPLAALAGTIVVAAVMVGLSIANTKPSAHADAPAPDLNALLPASAAGWQVTTSTDLFQFRDTLRTDHLAQRTYRRLTPNHGLTEVILYVAYWHAGQAPVSLVASHTPDACWPGSGWTQQSVPNQHMRLDVDHRLLPPAEYRLFKFGSVPQYVWFWHLYDGAPITYRDPYSAIELLRIAWNYGFRHDGDQLFIRVSCNRPWSEVAHEPFLEEFFAHVHPLGL